MVFFVPNKTTTHVKSCVMELRQKFNYSLFIWLPSLEWLNFHLKNWFKLFRIINHFCSQHWREKGSPNEISINILKQTSGRHCCGHKSLDAWNVYSLASLSKTSSIRPPTALFFWEGELTLCEHTSTLSQTDVIATHQLFIRRHHYYISLLHD